MRTFFFGDVDRQLYGVHNPPVGPVTADAAVLMCYPIGHEYMYAHRAFAQLASTLSGEGFHVLRFDYFGTGDSAGGGADATVTQWLTDIRAAATELQALSGAGEVSLLGLRAGAVLAAAATAAGDTVRDLVLWDPVIDGARYIAELEDLHQDFLDSSRPLKRYVGEARRGAQLLGFACSSELRRELAAMNLFGDPYRARRLVMLTAEQTAATEELREHMERVAEPFEHHRLSESPRWYAETSDPYALRLQGAALRAVVAAITADRA